MSPLALLFDKNHEVNVIIDKELLHSEKVGVHPGINTFTAMIKSDDLIKYIEDLENKIIYI